MERRLIEEYFEAVDELLAGLRPENLDLAVELASVPERIRGYGHVKERNAADAESAKAALLGRWRARDVRQTLRRAPPESTLTTVQRRPQWNGPTTSEAHPHTASLLSR